LLLEAPDLIAAVPTPKKWWAVGCAACPAPFLRLLASTSDDLLLKEEVGMHVAIAGEVPEADLNKELRSLLFRRIRRLRGTNRRRFCLLVEEGLIPAAFASEILPAMRFDLKGQGEVPEPERAGDELIEAVLEDGYTPELVCLLRLLSRHIFMRGEDRYDHWLGHVGRLLNPADSTVSPESFEHAANRFIRAAARARLRGELLTL
jgi:hypothetical protein